MFHSPISSMTRTWFHRATRPTAASRRGSTFSAARAAGSATRLIGGWSMARAVLPGHWADSSTVQTRPRHRKKARISGQAGPLELVSNSRLLRAGPRGWNTSTTTSKKPARSSRLARAANRRWLCAACGWRSTGSFIRLRPRLRRRISSACQPATEATGASMGRPPTWSRAISASIRPIKARTACPGRARCATP